MSWRGELSPGPWTRWISTLHPGDLMMMAKQLKVQVGKHDMSDITTETFWPFKFCYYQRTVDYIHELLAEHTNLTFDKDRK